MLIWFSLINPPFWGTTISGNLHIIYLWVRNTTMVSNMFSLKPMPWIHAWSFFLLNYPFGWSIVAIADWPGWLTPKTSAHPPQDLDTGCNCDVSSCPIYHSRLLGGYNYCRWELVHHNDSMFMRDRAIAPGGFIHRFIFINLILSTPGNLCFLVGDLPICIYIYTNICIHS